MNVTLSSISFSTLADVVRSFPNWGDNRALSYFNGFRIQHYSYRKLFQLSLRCAAYLQDKGITKGDRILVWAPNRPEWGVLFCACALSGVVLVPLDARNTPEFVVRVGKETEARILFRSHNRHDPGLPIPTVFMEDLFEILNDASDSDSFSPVRPQDALEIVYTSGTTGNPKGVVLTQENILSNLLDILDIIPVDGTYRLLSVLPLSHVLEQTAGFWAPLAGEGSILYLYALKPSALFEAFQRDSITVMILVPRLLALLKQRIENTLQEKHLGGYLQTGLRFMPHLPRWLRRAYFYPIHRRINPQFELFVSGGSSLPPDVEIFWKSLGFELIQGYGLTETSPVLTATRPGEPRLGSVGKPLRNVTLRLSGDREILAQGPNVFSGYYKNPVATGEVFENGWFKTGDVGEFDPDGFLYIRSRKKDIIVTSDGINVYPEDIERILDKVPGVKESCVIGVGAHEEIVHAVLLPANPDTDLHTVVAEANLQLPPEERIQSWSRWPLDEFPKTTTLKIKKGEVRNRLSLSESSTITGPSAEGSLFQKILCEIIGIPLESLQPDAQLGKNLGLSSIGRVELLSRLEEEFRLDIDDESIAAETTIRDLERLIAQRIGPVHPLPFRRWTLSPLCRFIRWGFNHSVMRILLRLFCDIRCLGLENVQNLEGPLLIVSNHTSHVDTPLIASLLPMRIGDHIAPAAWKEYFDTEGQSFRIRMGKWAAWQIATILFNIFPFPQTTAYRRSMAYAGELADKGWSILFFPEGARTRDGNWGDFHDGIGILAQNLHIPILPVAIEGGDKVLPANTAMPRRNIVRIAFGQPFLPLRSDYRTTSSQIKQTLQDLHKQLLIERFSKVGT